MLNRIFLSADIEGTCGIAHWDETELGKPDYEPFRRQMTREVAAACEGAFAAGCEDLLIKDAHDSARNLIPAELPERVSIFRGWGSDIHSMMSGIDASFYPGVKQIGPRTVRFSSDAYYDVLRFFMFCL